MKGTLNILPGSDFSHVSLALLLLPMNDLSFYILWMKIFWNFNKKYSHVVIKQKY